MRSEMRRAPRPTVARTVLATVVLTLALAATATAKPIARFTFTPLHPRVGTLVRFDGRASLCDIPPCGYVWRAYQVRSDGTLFPRLGINFALLPVATYRFTKAGLWVVTLSVTNSGPGRAGPGSARESSVTKSLRVAPATA
jgi:hypothetical protein